MRFLVHKLKEMFPLQILSIYLQFCLNSSRNASVNITALKNSLGLS